MFKKLLSGLGIKYSLFTVLTPVAMIGEVLMETFIPFLMARIIDNGISSYDLNYVYRYGLIMLGATLFSLLCGTLGGRLSSVAALGFSKNLRSKLFRKVQGFSFSQSDVYGTPSLITRLTTDVTNMQNIYQNLIRSMVRSPLMLIGGTVMALRINSRLAAVFLITIPVIAVFLSIIAVTAYPRFAVMLKKYDTLNTIVQENLIAIRVVKAFVRGDFECRKFEDVAGQVRDAQRRAEKVVVLNAPVMQISIYMCICAALWFGGNMVITGSMKTGELISFLTYVTQILMSLMMLSMLFVGFVLTRASVSRVMEILDEKDLEKNSPENTLMPQDGSVEFEHVWFSYSGSKEKAVLSDINLKIESGSSIGIIGGTGSSKSTLVSLIPRLYDCLEGQVKVGGRNVQDYSFDSLRKAVGVVMQKNLLFSGTIAENLRWGNETASDSQLEEALKSCAAWDFVMNFPEGLNTQLGQGGVNLSGGQKQRLCIARALLKNPLVLILDDSTSAVDTATDLRIRKSLRENLPGTTKLIISQRIASVQDADMIVVLDDGKINGTGTHDQLLENNSLYREVYQSQMSKN